MADPTVISIGATEPMWTDGLKMVLPAGTSGCVLAQATVEVPRVLECRWMTL